MENATKALLIAAGMLMAIMILSLLLIGYNEISNYYNERHKNAVVQQTIEFNNKFENYNREKIRGSDMISLMNRIIDYNTTQHFEQGTGYKRIIVTIDIGVNKLDQFRYITNSNKSKYNVNMNNKTILPTNGIITNRSSSDSNLKSITTQISNLISSNQNLGLTDTNLQRLSSNISNIVLEKTVENSSLEDDLKKKEKRKQLLTNVLKISESDINSNLRKIEQIICQYYEYTQFKRAYFDCTEAIYDENTGRVCEMNFKIRTDSNGNVEFN